MRLTISLILYVAKAFLKAWEAVCGATDETPTLIIPADKTFLLTPISFHGPCKSTSLHVQVIIYSNTLVLLTLFVHVIYFP